MTWVSAHIESHPGIPFHWLLAAGSNYRMTIVLREAGHSGWREGKGGEGGEGRGEKGGEDTGERERGKVREDEKEKRKEEKGR